MCSKYKTIFPRLLLKIFKTHLHLVLKSLKYFIKSHSRSPTFCYPSKTPGLILHFLLDIFFPCRSPGKILNYYTFRILNIIIMIDIQKWSIWKLFYSLQLERVQFLNIIKLMPSIVFLFKKKIIFHDFKD